MGRQPARFLLLGLLALAATLAHADELADLGSSGGSLSCADWSRKVGRLEKFVSRRNPGPTPTHADIAYGSAPRETLDVYAPPRGSAAPVILMVHGGGWCVGDKRSTGVTENKVARWVARGLVFVSVNYPMVGDGSDARAQAAHVARAAAYVQANAARWGGDPARLVLMGHSAGAHLVSLVNADAQLRQAAGLRPLLGTVSLDAGAIDVEKQMPVVYPFLRTRYREAFGDAAEGWRAASPFHRIDASAAPWLGVCSTTRKDDPCGQARAYADKSNALGVRASVLPEAMSHGAINKELGEPGAYTRDVESFLAALDPALAALLRD